MPKDECSAENPDPKAKSGHIYAYGPLGNACRFCRVRSEYQDAIARAVAGVS